MAKSSFPQGPDMTKFFTSLKFPMLDMQLLVGIQKKNVEAMQAANQLTVEGLQALVRRQVQIMQENVSQASQIMGALVSAGTPEDKILRQVDLVKSVYESALSNAKELTELASKSNGEATEILTSRVADSLAEMKSVAESVVRKAA